MDKLVVGLDEVGNGDVAVVGGKNASLGEMINGLSAVGVKVCDRMPCLSGSRFLCRYVHRQHHGFGH